MGSAAFVKQLFYGITATTTQPNSCWIDYVNAAYDRGLGRSSGWPASTAARSGVSRSPIGRAIMRALRRGMRGWLPGRRGRPGRPLYIQLWNEPN